MPAWILAALKWVPGIGKVLDKVGAENSRVQEIKAQAELEEVRAFRQKGRVGPTLLMRYVTVCIFAVTALCIVVAAFVPGAISIDWHSIVDAAKGLLPVAWGM